MVGFGSSLRKARRPGWEGAYLDYETLKLLLSQIESIYEEEAQRTRDDEDDGVFVDDTNRKRRNQRDFRHELFLQSDSDLAYPSVDEERSGDSRYLKETVDQYPGAFIGTPGRSLAASYSVETNSSSEDDERINEAGCGGALSSWTTATNKNTKQTQSPKKRRQFSNAVGSSLYEEDDKYFVGNAYRSNSNAFILEGREEDKPYLHEDPESSILSAPVRRTYADERSSLLASASKSQSNNSAFTPYAMMPNQHSNNNNNDNSFSPLALYYSTDLPGKPTTPHIPRQSSIPSVHANSKTVQKFQEERERDRLIRRARREQRKRMQEKKVPRRLRRAHAKARAITERFIGLLKAECEKVELFASVSKTLYLIP